MDGQNSEDSNMTVFVSSSMINPFKALLGMKDGKERDGKFVNQMVQNLLQQMQSRFQTMSESIITKIDEMGNRINELDQSINDLKAEMGMEGSSPSLPPRIQKSDEAKQEEGSA